MGKIYLNSRCEIRLWIFSFLLLTATIPTSAQPKMVSKDVGQEEYYLALSSIDKINIDNYSTANASYAFKKSVVPVKNVDVGLTEFSKGSGLRFLVVHNNENTGVAAAFDYIDNWGGSVLTLEYGNTRYINFSDSLNNYFIDPNHIFSDSGICRDVDRFCNGLITVDVHNALRELSEHILKEYNYDSLGYMITLHNNTDGNYDIYSYVKDRFFKNAAVEVNINKQMDPDDLVFVTSPCFFEYLKSRNINTVLQSPGPPGDGSLSVFAADNNIPYANIEVQFGHKAEQLRLIKIVNEMIGKCVVKASGKAAQTAVEPVLREMEVIEGD